MTEIIRTLAHTDTDTLYEAFDAAFSDYARSWTKEEFNKMMQRRHFVAELSFGAFDGDKLVAFTLNGQGLFHGAPSAYDVGTGTLPAYRGKGLSNAIFTKSLPVIRDHGLRQYILEVLTDNAPAIAVYTKLGFSVSRTFDYYISGTADINTPVRALPQGLELRETGLTSRQEMQSMWDCPPSWQNSFEALDAEQEAIAGYGVYDKEILVGYGLIEKRSGDIPQLAVHPRYRRRGIASIIFQALLAANHTDTIKLINIDHNCCTMTAFLSAMCLQPTGQQYEMIQSLG